MTDKYISGLLDEFFSCLEDGQLLKRLSDLCDINGFGACTCAVCMTSYGLLPNDEDYFGENCVKITFMPPMCRDDFSFIVTNEIFIEALEKRVEEYVKSYPEDKTAAYDSVKRIKEKIRCQG